MEVNNDRNKNKSWWSCTVLLLAVVGLTAVILQSAAVGAEKRLDKQASAVIAVAYENRFFEASPVPVLVTTIPVQVQGMT